MNVMARGRCVPAGSAWRPPGAPHPAWPSSLWAPGPRCRAWTWSWWEAATACPWSRRDLPQENTWQAAPCETDTSPHLIHTYIFIHIYIYRLSGSQMDSCQRGQDCRNVLHFQPIPGVCVCGGWRVMECRGGWWLMRRSHWKRRTGPSAAELQAL